MKTFIALFLLSTGLAFSTNLRAELCPWDPTGKENGCGPSNSPLLSFIVPEASPLSGCQFESACNCHDTCYGRCAEGGDLYGTPTCLDVQATAQRKTSCDARFLQDIIDANKTSDGGERLICNIYARVYKGAVVGFGGGSFNGSYVDELARIALEQNVSPEDIIRQNAFNPRMKPVAQEVWVGKYVNEFDLLRFEKSVSNPGLFQFESDDILVPGFENQFQFELENPLKNQILGNPIDLQLEQLNINQQVTGQ